MNLTFELPYKKLDATLMRNGNEMQESELGPVNQEVLAMTFHNLEDVVYHVQKRNNALKCAFLEIINILQLPWNFGHCG